MKSIKIWRFADAPSKYAVLSDHGGVEDYVAFVPRDLIWDAEELINQNRLGCCDVQKVEIEAGDQVWIGARS